MFDRYNVEKCDVTSYVCSIGYFSAHKVNKTKPIHKHCRGFDLVTKLTFFKKMYIVLANLELTQQYVAVYH